MRLLPTTKGFYGYHVSLNKIKATTLGKQILDQLDKAYKLNPNDVQILLTKVIHSITDQKCLVAIKKKP